MYLPEFPVVAVTYPIQYYPFENWREEHFAFKVYWRKIRKTITVDIYSEQPNSEYDDLVEYPINTYPKSKVSMS